MDTMNRRAREAVDAATLYHYTDQAGFLGILRTGEIWATSVRYLNDSEEFELARSALIKTLQRRSGDASGYERQDAERVRSIVTADVAPARAFVASLSAAADDLSQWRSYASGVGGLAIGFSRVALLQHLPPWAHLWPCAYTDAEQQPILDEFIADALETVREWRERGAKDETWPTFRDLIVNFVIRTAPLLKDAAFTGEREWRYIMPAYPQRPPYSTCYRPGVSMMRPYIKLPLDERLQPSLFGQGPPTTPPPRPQLSGKIVRVIVGPTPHRELASESTRAAVQDAGLSGDIVRNTKVPYRGW